MKNILLFVSEKLIDFVESIKDFMKPGNFVFISDYLLRITNQMIYFLFYRYYYCTN